MPTAAAQAQVLLSATSSTHKTTMEQARPIPEPVNSVQACCEALLQPMQLWWLG